MKLGIVGLGRMGRPIAINLAKSGAEVIAVNRGTGPFAELEASGIATSTDASRLAEADIIFLCLPDAHVVRQVLFGKAGLVPLLAPGAIVVDLSTIDYSAAVDIAAELESRQIHFIDAPVSGMEARAIDGSLTVMCGGDPKVFDTVRQYLQHIGTTILFMGPSGSGQLTKLVNQLLFDINAAALAEILPMAVKLGLDPDKVGYVVNSGTGRSYASEFLIPRMLKGNFADGYPMQSAYKDLISGAKVSADKMIPMPVLAAATCTYQAALRMGHGEKDKGGMVLVYEHLLGVAFRSSGEAASTNAKERS